MVTDHGPGGRFPSVRPGAVDRAADAIRLGPVVLAARLGAQLTGKQPAFAGHRTTADCSLLNADTARYRALRIARQQRQHLYSILNKVAHTRLLNVGFRS